MIIASIVGMKGWPIVALTCISLLTNDVECLLFMQLLAIICLLLGSVIKFLAHLLIELLILIESGKGTLYILSQSP